LAGAGGLQIAVPVDDKDIAVGRVEADRDAVSGDENDGGLIRIVGDRIDEDCRAAHAIEDDRFDREREPDQELVGWGRMTSVLG